MTSMKLVRLEINFYGIQTEENRLYEVEFNTGRFKNLFPLKIEFAEIQRRGLGDARLHVWIKCSILKPEDVVNRVSFYVMSALENEKFLDLGGTPLAASGAWIFYGLIGRPGMKIE